VQAILAAVPCIHIFNAMETCATYGRVAFGSDAASFFEDDKGKSIFAAGTPVFIAASSPKFGHRELYKNGYATFRAEFAQWVAASQGKHSDPRVRPPSTADDSSFRGFWEVTSLRVLSEAIPRKHLFADGADHPIKKLPPRGPLKVNWHNGS
jgi:hypothetical protein